MAYEMKQLRKEDISLFYYIKHIILADFIEKEELASLTRLDLHDSWQNEVHVYEALTSWASENSELPIPAERGRGWVYLDYTTVSGADQCNPYTLISGTDTENNEIYGIPEQSLMVTVYSGGGEIISDVNYMIDYIDGRIIVPTYIIPSYVDYSWYYVSVVDEWAAVESAKPPVVVIDMNEFDKSGYQLGAGKKIVRKIDIHIFASNPAERNDLTETLYDGFFNRSCPLYDFPYGTMLDHDGTWYGRRSNTNKLTSLFNRITSTNIIGNLAFIEVKARHISLPLVISRDRNEVMLSDLNAYRSKISFDMISYTSS